MKVYLDFDGVILDTDSVLDVELSKVSHITRSDFVKNYDWDTLMRKDLIINNSLDKIKKSKYNISLLSKISSMNEGIAKVKFLRNNGVLINIHLVPTSISKSDIVNAKGNILIDDKLYNLDKWVEQGGIAIFFNKNHDNKDVYGKVNTKYTCIDNLDILLDENYFN